MGTVYMLGEGGSSMIISIFFFMLPIKTCYIVSSILGLIYEKSELFKLCYITTKQYFPHNESRNIFKIDADYTTYVGKSKVYNIILKTVR